MGSGVLLLAAMLGIFVLMFYLRAEEPPEHFLTQVSAECYFRANGSQSGSGPPPQVRYLNRYVYGRQELVRFDSDRGEYEAVATFGEPIARAWNSRKEVLEDARTAVDYFCRHNYGIYVPFARERKVQPLVEITPSENSPSTLLICTVDGFFPSKTNITWFWNGKEEEKTRVFTTDLIRNGDWTFQMAVLLETQPERGDVYTCQVEHASFPEPVSVQWESQSDSARNKMWTGVAGFVLGLVFLAPGLILWVKNKKGHAIPRPSELPEIYTNGSVVLRDSASHGIPGGGEAALFPSHL